MRRYPGVKELAKLDRPGRYAVGHGAFLQISQWNTRAWVFRYVRNGKAHHVGLGSARYVTLQEARAKAFELRRGLINGVDPLEAKRAAKSEQVRATARSRTFRECALEYIAAHENGWRGDRSRRQWVDSLTKHVFPKIGHMAVADVDVVAVLSVLDPIARKIPETAARIKNRIGLILDWAASRDLRSSENPAKRPNLLPKRKKQLTVRHFAAMPYAQMPAFMPALHQRPEISARALEFLILTAARPGEVLGARWGEIEGDVWKVPGERMKSGKEHRVPLTARVVEILASLPREGEFIFIARRSGAQMHATTMNGLLGRMGRGDVTAHGFRSTFRDWAAETTSYPNHVVEMALAHAIGNGVEEAYRRGDLFEKRRQLMQDWADYCGRV